MCIYLYMINLLMNWLFYQYKIYLFISSNTFWLKIDNFCYLYSHPYTLLVIICRNIFFHNFTFTLFIYFGLKLISYKHDLVSSWLFFFFHSTTICMLIGKFNMFIFKRITNNKVLIFAIFYVCLTYFLFFTFANIASFVFFFSHRMI